MSFTQATISLTDNGVMTMLKAAISKADEVGQPQCIVIVDASGETLGEIRMNGAKFLSRKSALAKALTSASTGGASSSIPETVRSAIGLATEGSITGLPGGLPIRIDGVLVGGVGVGSGTGEQDVAVATAALVAVGAQN